MIGDITRRLQGEFAKNDGPFVRALDNALESFNVSRQAYYGGTFIGNHVQRCLEVKSLMCIHCRHMHSLYITATKQ